MEKRKLSQYETLMLASAYNLKNYCSNTCCKDCIFHRDSTICILTNPDTPNPVYWELYNIKKEGRY